VQAAAQSKQGRVRGRLPKGDGAAQPKVRLRSAAHRFAFPIMLK
jgi:hypothetical protein